MINIVFRFVSKETGLTSSYKVSVKEEYLEDSEFFTTMREAQGFLETSLLSEGKQIQVKLDFPTNQDVVKSYFLSKKGEPAGSGLDDLLLGNYLMDAPYVNAVLESFDFKYVYGSSKSLSDFENMAFDLVTPFIKVCERYVSEVFKVDREKLCEKCQYHLTARFLWSLKPTSPSKLDYLKLPRCTQCYIHRVQAGFLNSMIRFFTKNRSLAKYMFDQLDREYFIHLLSVPAKRIAAFSKATSFEDLEEYIRKQLSLEQRRDPLFKYKHCPPPMYINLLNAKYLGDLKQISTDPDYYYWSTRIHGKRPSVSNATLVHTQHVMNSAGGGFYESLEISKNTLDLKANEASNACERWWHKNNQDKDTLASNYSENNRLDLSDVRKYFVFVC